MQKLGRVNGLRAGGNARRRQGSDLRSQVSETTAGEPSSSPARMFLTPEPRRLTLDVFARYLTANHAARPRITTTAPTTTGPGPRLILNVSCDPVIAFW